MDRQTSFAVSTLIARRTCRAAPSVRWFDSATLIFYFVSLRCLAIEVFCCFHFRIVYSHNPFEKAVAYFDDKTRVVCLDVECERYTVDKLTMPVGGSPFGPVMVEQSSPGRFYVASRHSVTRCWDELCYHLSNTLRFNLSNS
jgi:hypothetical protein